MYTSLCRREYSQAGNWTHIYKSYENKYITNSHLPQMRAVWSKVNSCTLTFTHNNAKQNMRNISWCVYYFCFNARQKLIEYGYSHCELLTCMCGSIMQPYPNNTKDRGKRYAFVPIWMFLHVTLTAFIIIVIWFVGFYFKKFINSFLLRKSRISALMKYDLPL